MGNQLTCTIEFDELDPVEKDAFEAIKKENLIDERMRDSYVYHFKVMQDEEKEDDIIIDESLLTDKMIPFINKVDSKLK